MGMLSARSNLAALRREVRDIQARVGVSDDGPMSAQIHAWRVGEDGATLHPFGVHLPRDPHAIVLNVVGIPAGCFLPAEQHYGETAEPLDVQVASMAPDTGQGDLFDLMSAAEPDPTSSAHPAGSEASPNSPAGGLAAPLAASAASPVPVAVASVPWAALFPGREPIIRPSPTELARIAGRSGSGLDPAEPDAGGLGPAQVGLDGASLVTELADRLAAELARGEPEDGATFLRMDGLTPVYGFPDAVAPASSAEAPAAPKAPRERPADHVGWMAPRKMTERDKAVLARKLAMNGEAKARISDIGSEGPAANIAQPMALMPGFGSTAKPNNRPGVVVAAPVVPDANNRWAFE